jgi:NAD+ synthase (glutamine-hydrolysing)
MNIVIAQQNYHIGNFEHNTAKIIEAIGKAKQLGAELVVFSELAVCGYPPRDFLEFSDFILECDKAIANIAAATDGIAVLVGAPSRNPRPEGKNLFNSAYFLNDGRIAATVHKTLLPTYDIFDEYRYFEPSYMWQVIPFMGKKLAVTICEDIWNLSDDPLYRINPMDELLKQQPDIMINLSASPFDYVQAESRKHIVQQNAKKYALPLVYCNTVGSQTEIVFDGGSLVVNAQGEITTELPYFVEKLHLVTINLDHTTTSTPRLLAPPIPFSYPEALRPESGIANVHQALLLGIRDYFNKMGFSKAIVASSGGIDSALVLALACEAIGPENVDALLLPSQFSSDHSVGDAVALSENLSNNYEILNIQAIFEAFESTLAPVFQDRPFNVAEENLQSRIRGALVMALANKFNRILLNTSNKSELSTGYGTLYGDMAGGLAVIGDLYKTQVYALARYINRHKEVIPENILIKEPSAELRPGQKDSDSLPAYEVLDAVLYQYIERRLGPTEIIALGYDATLLHRILKLVNTNEYKRNQFCPIIRVSPKAFGIGRRVPIVGKYLS